MMRLDTRSLHLVTVAPHQLFCNLFAARHVCFHKKSGFVSMCTMSYGICGSTLYCFVSNIAHKKTPKSEGSDFIWI